MVLCIFQQMGCWKIPSTIIGDVSELKMITTFLEDSVLDYARRCRTSALIMAESEKHGEPRNRVPEEGFQK